MAEPADQRIAALAQQGRTQEALALLTALARSGDPVALFELAAWNLSGTHVPRDLVLARALFEQAGAAGHVEAALIHIAFLANGTGGPADWPEAIRLLRRRSIDEPRARRQVQLLDAMTLDPDGSPRISEGERITATPEIRWFPGLFTPEECTYLAEAAAPLFQPSVVVDPASGRLVRNPIRSSDAAAFPLVLENPAIHALNRRLAAASGTRASQGEPLQVLRYAPGQQYRLHSDALPLTDNQRILTVLVYLNQGYEGGETHFPAAGLSVRGLTGDALLFRNAARDGRPDPTARHAGLPVTRGTKLIASRWIREKPLDLMAGAR